MKILSSCPKTKQMVQYDALGAKYANDPEISITKIDATANDIPSPRMEANGYPTLYFYKHKTGDVIRFEGDRYVFLKPFLNYFSRFHTLL